MLTRCGYVHFIPANQLPHSLTPSVSPPSLYLFHHSGAASSARQYETAAPSPLLVLPSPSSASEADGGLAGKLR